MAIYIERKTVDAPSREAREKPKALGHRPVPSNQNIFTRLSKERAKESYNAQKEKKKLLLP